MIAGVDATQNTQIGGIQGVDLAQNASITIIQGVDLTQNTQIAGIQGVDLAQNSSISIIQGVDLTQNTWISSNVSFIAGVDATQNTQIAGIQGVDLAQNSAISIIQGVDLGQNSAIAIIQGVDLGQNATITAVNQYAAGAYAQANTNLGNINIINGVDATQNAWISANQAFTQAAFNQANTANTRAYNTVLKSGDTMTGALNITNGSVGITSATAALAVNGSIVSNNSLYMGGTGFFGTANGSVEFPNAVISAIGNSPTYTQIAVQNANAGVNSSTDFVATADNGTDTSTYIDMGINSSIYNQPGFGLTGPNDGYLYVQGNTSTGGGNLVLSTYTPKDIIFSQNGGDTPNETARFQYGVGLVMKNLPITFADGTSQNTAGSSVANTIYQQNINNTQNTQISGIQGVDLAQNSAISIIQGVDLGQNATITAVNQFAQAAYNQAMQGAGQLANLGQQQLAAQQGIYGLQNQYGAQQQALQQSILNQAMQDYANAQQYPLMQLGTMSNMLRGLPMQAQTTQQYQAAPNAITQGIGAVGAYGALSGALNSGKTGAAAGAEGGLPKEFKMKKMASEVCGMLQPEDQLPAWCQDLIASAHQDLLHVYEYMSGDEAMRSYSKQPVEMAMESRKRRK